MGAGQVTATDAVRGAVDFTRWAWRRAGLAQTMMAAGIAMMFVALRGAVDPGDAGRLFGMGFLVALVAWAPTWAALHRLVLDGAAAQRVRFGGLQFDRTEVWFLGLGLVAFFAVVLTLLPLVAISAGIFVLFRPLGLITLGPLGQFQISFLIAGLAWLAGLAGLVYAALRLAFAPAATASKRRFVVVETWPMTQPYQKALGLGWLLAQAPTLLCLALLALIDSIELQDRASHWPLADAIVGGAILGFAIAFVTAPLSAGVLGLLYRHQRAGRARLASRIGPPPAPRPAPKPVRRPEPGWEPLVIQRAISKPFPRLDQGA